jgi:hypothetical protein
MTGMTITEHTRLPEACIFCGHHAMHTTRFEVQPGLAVPAGCVATGVRFLVDLLASLARPRHPEDESPEDSVIPPTREEMRFEIPVCEACDGKRIEPVKVDADRRKILLRVHADFRKRLLELPPPHDTPDIGRHLVS